MKNIECIQVSTDSKIFPLPNWAKSAIEIGAWARYAANLEGRRLIICCVVPCRDVFTALVGVGAVAAGGTLFHRGFSWTDFMNLEPGTEIFWSVQGDKRKYAGIVKPHEENNGQILIPVEIKKGAKKNKTTHLFTESKFRECFFSEDRLPSAAKSDQIENAKIFYSNVGIPTDSSWLVTSNPEVRFITNQAAFYRSIKGWSLTTNPDNEPLSIENLLILKDEEKPAIAKSRITSVRGSLVKNCPISILDGPFAFDRIYDVKSGSLVIILERSEVMEEHIDLLFQIQLEHLPECEQEMTGLIPFNIPKSIEIAGYCIETT